MAESDSCSAAPPPASPNRGNIAMAVPSRSKGVRLLWVVLVVVVLLVAALGAGIELSPSSKSRSLPGPQIEITSPTFATVSSNLTMWAASYDSGGWSLLGAQGYAIPPSLIPGPVSVSAFINLDGGGSCTYTGLVSSSQTFDIPPTLGNLSSGNASYWRIDMTGNQGRVLTVLELAGAFYPLAAGTCSTNTTLTLEATTPAVIDSPVAAAVAWRAGGSSYVSNQSLYTVELAVSSGIEVFGHYFPPDWTVQYAACSGGVQFSSGPNFVATVNATTAGLAGSSWTGSAGCPPTG